MSTIWKFTLDDVLTVSIPLGGKILHVGYQHGEITLWVLVDPTAGKVQRKFQVIGTGWKIESNPGEHIGTVMDGSFVWHIFEVTTR